MRFFAGLVPPCEVCSSSAELQVGMAAYQLPVRVNRPEAAISGLCLFISHARTGHRGDQVHLITDAAN